MTCCLKRRLAALLPLLALPAAIAYDFDARGIKWPGARTTLHTAIPGTSPSGIPWAEAFADAANEWSDLTSFRFDLVPQYRDPCVGHGSAGGRPDFVNGADFRNNICGSEFNDQTIAVTVYFTENNILGSADLVEADIIFNANLAFDVYDGPQRSGIFDFRRVALHEIGHVLGLGHEDDVPAIMNSRIGNLFRLQDDDIEGVDVLYGGLKNCDNRPVQFGWTFGALTEGDCRVQQLVSGGSDDSFVDVYTLQLDQPMTVTLDTITDGGLDSVLLLSDSALDILSVDENTAGDCRPRITRTLAAGNYAVLVNTYSNLTNLPCGESNRGNYRLSMAFQSDQMVELRGLESFQGGHADAAFRGGVTRDGGLTYINRVSATEAFDVSGQISIDPQHQGQTGYIVVAAITDAGEILVKHPGGDFVAYQPDVQMVPIYQRRTLSATEDIEILKQMVAQNIGINTIEVNFLIGYGVDSQPDELYFHSQPINLLVE